MTILTNTNVVLQVGGGTIQIAQRDVDCAAYILIFGAMIYAACRYGYRFTSSETRAAIDAQAAADAKSAADAKLAKLGVIAR